MRGRACRNLASGDWLKKFYWHFGFGGRVENCNCNSNCNFN